MQEFATPAKDLLLLEGIYRVLGAFYYTLAGVIRISYFFLPVFLFYYILFNRSKKHFPVKS